MPTDDYIKRSDAINALTVSAMLRNLDSVEDGPAHMYKRAAERIIAGVPAADVAEVRHSRWAVTMLDGPMGMRPIAFYCENCFLIETVRTPYCPYCGAKMDKDLKEEDDV